MGASVGFGGGTATTDASGNYTLTGVPVGTVQLVASASGFQSATQSVTVSGGNTSTANFTLAAGATTGTVTGKITNASSGAIVSAATVSWSGGSTTSNTSGIYTLTNVTAGTQNITAVKTGYLSRTLAVGVTGGATSTLNIPIATAGKISVKVVTSGGAVVSGATVTIKGGVIATTVSGSSGSTGLFTTNWIPVGTYTVTVAKSGFATQTKTTTVSSGVTTSLTFTGILGENTMKNGQNTNLLMIAVIISFLASCPPSAAAQTYTATDLGTLHAGSARVHGVNDSGQAVGASGHPHGADTHAFFWQKQGGIRDLGTLPGGDYSSAYAINDSERGGRHFKHGNHHARIFLDVSSRSYRSWNFAGHKREFSACHQQSGPDCGQFRRPCSSMVRWNQSRI